MNGWMIDPDGDAVNLAHVATVQAQMRVRGGAWYACAFASNGKGLALSADMATQEDVVAWIATNFQGAKERVARPSGEPMGTGASGGCGSVRLDHASPPHGPYCRLSSGHGGDHDYGSLPMEHAHDSRGRCVPKVDDDVAAS